MTKVITTHVPLDLADRVDQWAARLQRSRGWIVKQALAAWVDHADSGHGGATGFAEAQQAFDTASTRLETAKTLAAVATLKSLRQTTTLGDIPWQELRDAGRR
jgi:predicted transcriptional regulator